MTTKGSADLIRQIISGYFHIEAFPVRRRLDNKTEIGDSIRRESFQISPRDELRVSHRHTEISKRSQIHTEGESFKTSPHFKSRVQAVTLTSKVFK